MNTLYDPRFISFTKFYQPPSLDLWHFNPFTQRELALLQPQLQASLQPKQKQKEDDVLLFHTTTWNAAAGFAEMHSNLMPGTDFSIYGNGLYVTPDWDDAVDFATKVARTQRTNRIAIMGFRVSGEFLKGFAKEHVKLETNTEQGLRVWQHFVKACRLDGDAWKISMSHPDYTGSDASIISGPQAEWMNDEPYPRKLTARPLVTATQMLFARNALYELEQGLYGVVFCSRSWVRRQYYRHYGEAEMNIWSKLCVLQEFPLSEQAERLQSCTELSDSFYSHVTADAVAKVPHSFSDPSSSGASSNSSICSGEEKASRIELNASSSPTKATSPLMSTAAIGSNGVRISSNHQRSYRRQRRRRHRNRNRNRSAHCDQQQAAVFNRVS